MKSVLLLFSLMVSIPNIVLSETNDIPPVPEGSVQTGEHLDLLSDSGYEFDIIARLINQESEAIWDMEISRQTISGRAISIRLEGESIVILAQFTPYELKEDTVFLVAQGQTWLSVDEDEGVRYRTAFKSLELVLDESLLFFPLGYKFAEESGDGMNLEIEIKFSSIIFAAENE
ncbi:hypothetical protein [Spirochaeta dissipatitropha]